LASLAARFLRQPHGRCQHAAFHAFSDAGIFAASRRQPRRFASRRRRSRLADAASFAAFAAAAGMLIAGYCLAYF